MITTFVTQNSCHGRRKLGIRTRTVTRIEGALWAYFIAHGMNEGVEGSEGCVEDNCRVIQNSERAAKEMTSRTGGDREVMEGLWRQWRLLRKAADKTEVLQFWPTLVRPSEATCHAA
jgi:hypothetical protein